VRGAAPGDAATIADIHIRTWQVAYAHVFPEERLEGLESRRTQRERHWRGMIESPPWPSQNIVAERSGRIVGFASLGHSRADESVGELYAIYVLPDAWGGGAGRALMSAAIELLRADGFEEAVLWVLEDNPRARAFYERCGWTLDSELREETFLETVVRELRYRIALDSSP
jgi:GNAT superfamily N-acetyltransferase